MKIKTVTITGADNDTNINEMLEISRQFPFVEWGILFSPKRIGEERYPDLKWIGSLTRTEGLRLSAHLCGGYTREMLIGESHLIESEPIKACLKMFNRYQLNFNSYNSQVNRELFLKLLTRLGWNFILQFNDSNMAMCMEVMKYLDISLLCDSSGGNGKLAQGYLPSFGRYFTGYAGGLSPENLEEELKKIELVAGDSEIWIDTESGVRTDSKLDIDKVKKFLEIASKYTTSK